MQAVTGKFLEALRHPHTRTSTAEHRNLVTGAVTDLPITDGAVTVDATSKIRRTLSLTLPGTEDLYEALDTEGGEISVGQTIRYADRTEESVALGTFIVDQDQIDYTPGGTIGLTCPDRWLKVQRNRFGLTRSSVPSNAVWQEIQRLVEGAWPGGTYPFPGWASIDTSATTKVGSLVWDDGDREGAITGLAATSGLEVFFDAQGLAVLRKIPMLTPTSPAVWTVDASSSGVMIGATRVRDRSTMRNALIITTSATDVTFLPVEVKNTTGGDPLNVTGPLGYVAEEWSSPNFRNSAQARAAGLTRLGQRLGIGKQLSLTAVGNPALDAEDVITVLLPQVDRNTPRPVELHIIDTITHPLMPAGTQDISTRSTRPLTDGT